MTISTALLMVLGLIPIVIILFNPNAVKRRAVARKKREDEEKTELELKAKQLENFRKQRLVVYVREKDGRKCAFEAVLIGALLKIGVTVVALSEKDGRSIASGDTTPLKNNLLALIGTSWIGQVKHEGYNVTPNVESNGYYQPSYIENITHCDYRVLRNAETGGGQILVAGSNYSSDKCRDYPDMELATEIVEDLLKNIPITTETN